mmetsp:Transcript_15231/g.18045  ORF Transcript_15231/g.18045 Transcript_15231/m.18045 type:complete len:124 (-) Transcript_15231:43-414(-)
MMRYYTDGLVVDTDVTDTNTDYEFDYFFIPKNKPGYSIVTYDDNYFDINDWGRHFFFIRLGLYGTGGISFESTMHPGKYIRARGDTAPPNFFCWLGTNDGSEVFEKDATFLIRAPLALDAMTD